MDQHVPSLIREKCFIDGAWVGEPGLTVTNPATGDEIATVPSLGADETRDAIAAADRAFKTWRKTTAKERSAILRRWFELQIEHADELARIMTAEQGKPLAEAKGEVVYAGSGLKSYGQLVIVKHNDTWLTAYGFNSLLMVREGDRVGARQQIAEMGRNSRGRQLLHFEIRRNGKPVDPLGYLPKR